ncbi:hypothetical protein MRS44_002009 [Fusarium solani]|uniref:uncharacterized protein n=1 Tax=Fusarium solani TaxID=169388 RepID=UPI0032C43318|nr:hypothetical protein MRS44_002009 [Fusarium solani]
MDEHRGLTSLVGATARPSLPARLDGCKFKIEELMRIAGTARLSFGVYRQGEPAYFVNLGYRIVEQISPVEEENIFSGCSLTKIFVAMAPGRAVDEGKLAWDTRVKDLLADFNIDNRVLRDSMTVTDILTHRTGMSIADFYLGSKNNIVISHDDRLKFINDQVPIKPFRQDAFFDPFSIERTYIGRPPSDVENVSRAYNTLEDATPVKVPIKSGRGTFGGSSGGIFTCVADLLKAYAAVMDAFMDQFSTAEASTPSTQIKLAQDLFFAKIPMAQPTYHEASLPGALSAITMVPEHRAAIFVMTNSLSFNDCPDWVFQLLLQEILDAPNHNDYVKLSKESAEKSLQWFKDTSAALDKERINNTSPKPLEAYVGTYWNYLRIDVTLDDGELSWV